MQLGSLWRDFRGSFAVAVLGLAGAGLWGARRPEGAAAAVWVAMVLSVMEVTLSFDNAVVNASVLREMSEAWRRRFLTVGILIAVFGMRLVFPVLIVSVATGNGVIEVAQLALTDPNAYARHLHDHHAGIAAFGGVFLLLVSFSFLFDDGRDLHWLGSFEQWLARLGKVDSFGIVLALGILLALQWGMPLRPGERLVVLVAGISGVVLFVLVSSLDKLFAVEESGAVVKSAQRSGLMAFLYLELLDASFSFDGVIGAFAITRDVVILMTGLAIGAMFVRSMTIFLVNRGTLDAYVYLEHGAHYAIGVLGFVMLTSIAYEVPEVVSGFLGIAFIVAAVISSLGYRRRVAQLQPDLPGG